MNTIIEEIIKCQNLKCSAADFITLNPKVIDKVDWESVCKDFKLSEEFIENFIKHINYNLISQYQDLSIEFIDKHVKQLDMELICKYQKLSMVFIKKHLDKISWSGISKYQKLTEAFIENYAQKLDLENIFVNQKLSEKFIEKYTDNVNWESISIHQKLSRKFIEKYADKLDWVALSMYQKLSESFMSKYYDKLNWDYLSLYQKMSEKFISKYRKRVNWRHIVMSQKLSNKFRTENFALIVVAESEENFDSLKNTKPLMSRTDVDNFLHEDNNFKKLLDLSSELEMDCEGGFIKKKSTEELENIKDQEKINIEPQEKIEGVNVEQIYNKIKNILENNNLLGYVNSDDLLNFILGGYKEYIIEKSKEEEIEKAKNKVETTLEKMQRLCNDDRTVSEIIELENKNFEYEKKVDLANDLHHKKLSRVISRKKIDETKLSPVLKAWFQTKKS